MKRKIIIALSVGALVIAVLMTLHLSRRGVLLLDGANSTRTSDERTQKESILQDSKVSNLKVSSEQRAMKREFAEVKELIKNFEVNFELTNTETKSTERFQKAMNLLYRFSDLFSNLDSDSSFDRIRLNRSMIDKYVDILMYVSSYDSADAIVEVISPILPYYRESLLASFQEVEGETSQRFLLLLNQ